MNVASDGYGNHDPQNPAFAGGYAVASGSGAAPHTQMPSNPAVPQAAPGRLVAMQLLEYIEGAYIGDEGMDVSIVLKILNSCPGPLDWSVCSDDELPILHMAVMSEEIEPETMVAIVTALLKFGAPTGLKDGDGDTALQAVLSLAEDCERDGEGPSQTLSTQVAAVTTLLQHPSQSLDTEQAKRVCQWLRHYGGKRSEHKATVLSVLSARLGDDQVSRFWISQEMMSYLEKLAYEAKKPVKASKVRSYLEKGASPCTAQTGASALLLCVLNPFSTLDQLIEVFRMMLEKEPEVAGMRDGFKLSALQWAADYRNVGTQHGLKVPNPAALLALMPNVIDLVPVGIDANECCFKAAPDGFCTSVVPPECTLTSLAKPTRFLEGHRVICRVEEPGGGCSWEEGVVTGLWYRERCWPAAHPGAPYEVKLDIGRIVFSLVDNDRIVREESRTAHDVNANAAAAAAASTGTPAAAPKAKSAGRFQTRQREDGKWEMLDTTSGITRPCAPPGSDDDD